MDLMKKFSQIVSGVFSPLLIPSYGTILVSYLTIMRLLPLRYIWLGVGVVFMLTCLIPIAGIFALYKAGFVKDAGLNERTERTVPYILTILCYLGAGFFLYRAGTPLWIDMFFAGGALAALISIIVNRWWKISAHGAAMGGLTAFVFRMAASHYAIYNLEVWMSVVVIATGLVLTSRVFLNRHTLMQVLLGAANGFLCVWLLSMIQ